MSPCTWLQRNEPEQAINLFVCVTGTFLPAFMPTHDVLGTRLGVDFLYDCHSANSREIATSKK